jgi:CRISPR/Cas system CSM-associated protein Csm3 (group 7 of RAMP superfamily)
VQPLREGKQARSLLRAGLRRRQHHVSASAAYAEACPACRLFGSTHFIGRFQPADAMPDRKLLAESRDGVGIDRVSGGAYSGAKFEYSVVPAGSVFRTRIAVQNFEMWQMGLLALILRDFMAGFIRIGSGKARGLGGVKAHLTGWRLYQFGKNAPGREVRGIGAQMEQAGEPYRLIAQPDTVSLPEALAASWQREGLRWSLSIPKGEHEPVLASMSEVFIACAEANRLPRVAQ